MNQSILRHKPRLFYPLLGLFLAGYFLCPSPAISDHPLLREIIIAHNLETLRESLIDDSHQGEEGILRIRPEIAKSLGMKVFIDQDYLDAKELFEKGKIFLEKAEMALSSKEKEAFKGEHAQKIADHYLISKRSVELAKKKLMAYRSRLNSSKDERLDEGISVAVMDRLLEESLKKTGNRLRDALGWFYNTCQGENGSSQILTPENVTFVNEVFHQFVSQASQSELSLFDLDRDDGYKNKKAPYNWKNAVGKEASQYIPLLEAAFNKLGDKIYRIDPLLFLALIKQESNFDPLAVSLVGAAGLTQIMPKTGKNLGMKNIYAPSYFNEAVSLLTKERNAKQEALAALLQITEENKLYHARRARELVQKSLVLGKKREKLFSKYKKELLQKRTDDRLQPSIAIEYGVEYFAGLMKAQKGDISLALAAYNAGPHRVKKFNGIPPYEETVIFRNRVLGFYWDYLSSTASNP